MSFFPFLISTAVFTTLFVTKLLALLGDIYSIIGPLTGASLVLLLGFEAVLLFDSLTFLIAIGLISLLQLTPKVVSDSDPLLETHQDISNTHSGSLPVWSINGLKSWFFVSICLGFLGVAGPAMVIPNHSEHAWALIATCIAIGSLFGSTSILSGRFKFLEWNRIHLICLCFLPLQLVAVSSTLPAGLIAISALLGACSTTMSGIKWDSVTQTRLTANQLPHFASSDQMVTNTGIPIGMVLFGVTSHFGFSDYALMAIVSTVALSYWFIRAGMPQELVLD